MGTTEQFIEEARKVHGNRYDYSKVVYVNNRTKVCIICPEHGEFWQTPKNHKRGQGCPVCGKEYAINYHKNNYNQFLTTAKDRFGDRYFFPNIADEYENSHSKITVVCNYCGNTFTKIACDIITSQTGGCWCKETEKAYITHKEINLSINGFTIKPFEGKKNRAKDNVIAVCEKCGYENKLRISTILGGNYSCKRCVALKSWDGKRLTVEDIRKRMEEYFPTIKVDYLSYTGIAHNITCECSVCGHKFNRTPNTFFNMKDTVWSPCPECTKKMISQKRSKTTEQFIKETNAKYGENRYEIIGTYKSSDKKIEIRCIDCGRTFEIEANSFLQGHGCPYHNCNSSTKEKEIADFIRGIYDGDIYNNDRTLLNGKELDVFIPEKKIAFEYDGVFWHNENNKERDFHLWKTNECDKLGVHLVHIFEDEWLYKKPIWESMIRNHFNKTNIRIFARKCDIGMVDKKECKEFLEENHLQGWCPSQIKYGLYYKGELVSVMTFGKSRHFIGNGESEYELLRFCNKINTSVVGGASKLFKHFVSDYIPTSVVTYADKRWSNGNLYEQMGFVYDHDSKPNYYYVIGDRRKNRFNFRKSELIKKYGCPENISEHEFCKSKGWYRIYDCGTKVYKWFNHI